MKHGCMVMTLRLSSSHHSGSRQIHRSQKKHVKFAAVSSPCWSFFSISKALSTRNSYLLVKPSMASFTVRFWSGWGRAFSTNIQTSGRKTIGFSTMTTRLLTHHSLFNNSWLPKTFQLFPTPLFIWPRPLQLFPLPQGEITAERVLFWHDWGDPCRNVRGYWHTHIWELPGMHEIMGNTLGSLYTCPMGLLRRRRWRLGVTVRNFFLWSNSPNFWIAPRRCCLWPGTIPIWFLLHLVWWTTFVLTFYIFLYQVSLFPRVNLWMPCQCVWFSNLQAGLHTDMLLLLWILKM